MLAVYIWFSFNHRSEYSKYNATFLTMYLTNTFSFRFQRSYSLRGEKQNTGTTQGLLACAYCIYKIFILCIPNICEIYPLAFSMFINEVTT